MKIQTFLFNWPRQYENTCKIEKDLLEIFDNITIINSDDENKKENWINIGNESYFAKQFLTAVNLFDGDIFFHVQGDITFNKWRELINDAKKYFEEYNEYFKLDLEYDEELFTTYNVLYMIKLMLKTIKGDLKKEIEEKEIDDKIKKNKKYSVKVK